MKYLLTDLLTSFSAISPVHNISQFFCHLWLRGNDIKLLLILFGPLAAAMSSTDIAANSHPTFALHLFSFRCHVGVHVSGCCRLCTGSASLGPSTMGSGSSRPICCIRQRVDVVRRQSLPHGTQTAGILLLFFSKANAYLGRLPAFKSRNMDRRWLSTTAP